MKMTSESVNLLSSLPASMTLEGITPASLEKGAITDSFSTALTGQMTLLNETGELSATVPAKPLDGLPKADGKERAGFGNALLTSYKKMAAVNLEAGLSVSAGTPKAVTAAMIPDTALAAQNESQAMAGNEPAFAQPLPEAAGLNSPVKTDAARPDLPKAELNRKIEASLLALTDALKTIATGAAPEGDAAPANLPPEETVPQRKPGLALQAPKTGLNRKIEASLLALTGALKTIAAGAAPEGDAAPVNLPPRETVPQRKPELDLQALKTAPDGDMAASLMVLTDALKTIATGTAPEGDGVNSPVKTDAAPVDSRQKAPLPRQPGPDKPGLDLQARETTLNEDIGANLLALKAALKAVTPGAVPEAVALNSPGKANAPPVDFSSTEALLHESREDKPGLYLQARKTNPDEDIGASLLVLKAALKNVTPGAAPEAAGVNNPVKTAAAPPDFRQKAPPPRQPGPDKPELDLQAPENLLNGNIGANLLALNDALKAVMTGAAPEATLNNPVKTDAAPPDFRQKASPPRPPGPDKPGLDLQARETTLNEDIGASFLALKAALKNVTPGAVPEAAGVNSPVKTDAAPPDFRQKASPPRQPGPEQPGLDWQALKAMPNEDIETSLTALSDALKAVMTGEIPGAASKMPNQSEAMAGKGFSFAKPLPEAAGLNTTGKADAAPADFSQKETVLQQTLWDKQTTGLQIQDTIKPAEKTATVEKQAILPGLEKTTASAEMTPLQRPVDNRTDGPAITRPLTHPDWGKDLGEQIVWMNNKDLSAAEIKLNPLHLGPISVRIDINQDQATIVFTAHHADVREALEASIPKLREMLGAQQLNLVNVNISQNSTPDQGRPSSQNFQPPPENREPGRDAVADSLEKIEHERGVADKGLLSLYA